ncbi:MAG: DNA-processing protein DprA [Coriobacteriia bacterium]|nr:DNA-processing protein DprA [Coriobacteriia bacterium]
MKTTSQSYPGYQQFELAMDDPRYPARLHDLPDPPKRLYLIGDIGIVDHEAIAIVGSRKASPYGTLCSEHFAKRAVMQNLTVVSGGAVGCDQAAHLGALGLEAPTIVVLGCGPDVEYPNNSRSLFNQVLAHGGLIVSELPWGSPPARWAFVKRNRIIAGLALATLIVEAGMPSGTFSTADATLSLGRELLVIPGSILSKQSAGCNHLIVQGAWPIIDDASFDSAVADIYGPLTGLEASLIKALQDRQPDQAVHKNEATASQRQTSLELGPLPIGDQPADDEGPANTEDLIIEQLRAKPCRPDDLIGICGKDIVEVIRYLSVLEFTGKATRLADGRYYARLWDGEIDNGRPSHNSRGRTSR